MFGRENCGYSFFLQSFKLNDSSCNDFSESTHGISRTTESIKTREAISQLESTNFPIETSKTDSKILNILASIHS